MFIYMCVCVYVCANVCVYEHICMYVCAYTCTYVLHKLYVRTDGRTLLVWRLCMYMYMYVRVRRVRRTTTTVTRLEAVGGRTVTERL